MSRKSHRDRTDYAITQFSKNCGFFLIKGKFEDTKLEGVTISLNSKKDGIK
jgi:hypothetical protein